MSKSNLSSTPVRLRVPYFYVKQMIHIRKMYPEALKRYKLLMKEDIYVKIITKQAPQLLDKVAFMYENYNKYPMTYFANVADKEKQEHVTDPGSNLCSIIICDEQLIEYHKVAESMQALFTIAAGKEHKKAIDFINHVENKINRSILDMEHLYEIEIVHQSEYGKFLTAHFNGQSSTGFKLVTPSRQLDEIIKYTYPYMLTNS